MSDISPSPVIPSSVWRKRMTCFEIAFSGSDGPVLPISRVAKTGINSRVVIFILESLWLRMGTLGQPRRGCVTEPRIRRILGWRSIKTIQPQRGCVRFPATIPSEAQSHSNPDSRLLGGHRSSAQLPGFFEPRAERHDPFRVGIGAMSVLDFSRHIVCAPISPLKRQIQIPGLIRHDDATPRRFVHPGIRAVRL